MCVSVPCALAVMLLCVFVSWPLVRIVELPLTIWSVLVVPGYLGPLESQKNQIHPVECLLFPRVLVHLFMAMLLQHVYLAFPNS